ncbi:MAG: hypothetical protein ABW066_03155, partial [Sedimenticola sp.]
MRRYILLIFLGFLPVLSGCLTTPQKANDQQPSSIALPPSQPEISYGAVKKHLVIGKTTQADVLRLFGSPNNMTLDSSGDELWIYDKVKSTISSSGERDSSGGYIGGASTNNGSGLASGYGSSSTRSSSHVTSTVDTL